jgi:hypothetical protein
MAIGVSLQMSTVRASQQVSSVLILAVYAITSFVWNWLSVPFTAETLACAGGAALVMGALTLAALSRRFRRYRLFARI